MNKHWYFTVRSNEVLSVVTFLKTEQLVLFWYILFKLVKVFYNQITHLHSDGNILNIIQRMIISEVNKS